MTADRGAREPESVSASPLVLRWRRIARLSGAMPIEISGADGVLGRLTAANALASRYRAEAFGHVWQFRAAGFPRRCWTAHDAKTTRAIR